MYLQIKKLKNFKKFTFKRKKDKFLKVPFLKEKSNSFLYNKIILILILMLISIIIFVYTISNTDIKRFISNNILIYINKNNKGFLKINTIHKGNYTTYNFQDNIKVYKDLYSDISYVPITKSNSIIKTNQIVNDSYFKLCENKTLLDNTKYKRSKNPLISVIIPFYNKNIFSIYTPLRSIQN